ncbi:UNVERIFIED_CONTAM: hypothetical protein GTU68_041818 [Idotea baltica]|nr:hypothetical protein [Idotea baltica]
MIIITMGVSGCGKTTVGQLLAEQIGCKFYDADDFHPTNNIEKMRQGVGLSDEDRTPWLLTLNKMLIGESNQSRDIVLACSALKKTYRDMLSENIDDIKFIFLQGDFDLISQRLSQRSGHYMNPDLLQSQYDTLEEPDIKEKVIAINIGESPQAIIDKIVSIISTN